MVLEMNVHIWQGAHEPLENLENQCDSAAQTHVDVKADIVLRDDSSVPVWEPVETAAALAVALELTDNAWMDKCNKTGHHEVSPMCSEWRAAFRTGSNV